MDLRKNWFKRKRYGWGWVPSAWEGWVITGFFLAIIILIALSFDASTTLLEAGSMLLVPTLLLLSVCYMTGERPRWQWGEEGQEEDQ